MTLGSLSLSLKEVQKAKGSLESRLNERRQKRKNIESTLENVNSKLKEVRDLQNKMTETMKIAQHKVAQMQAQSDSMEASNQEKRDSLQSVNQKIKDLNEQRKGDMQKFEEELSKMAKSMLEAKDFYSEEKLAEKIAESKGEYNQHRLKSEQLDEETVGLTQMIATLENQSVQSKDDQINKQAVMDIFTEEHKSMIKCVESLNEEIQSTRRRLGKQTDVKRQQ